MNKLSYLIIAALVVGFLIFSVTFWILKKDINYSLNIALAGALGGLAAELLKSRWARKKKQENESLIKK